MHLKFFFSQQLPGQDHGDVFAGHLVGISKLNSHGTCDILHCCFYLIMAELKECREAFFTQLVRLDRGGPRSI